MSAKEELKSEIALYKSDEAHCFTDEAGMFTSGILHGLEIALMILAKYESGCCDE